MKPWPMLTLALGLIALAGGGRSDAAAAPTPPAPGSPPLVLEFDRIELQRVAQTLTERGKKSVLLDATVKPTTSVSSSGTAATVEEALDRITKPLGLTWKKVYVPKTSGVLNGERVARLVETVKEVASPGVVVEDPKSHQVTLYLRDLPAAPDLEGQIHAAWPFLQPVYLISDPRTAARRAEKPARPRPATPDQFAAMERERMDMFLKMAPDERAKAMQQSAWCCRRTRRRCRR
jgi:hypothetical protein